MEHDEKYLKKALKNARDFVVKLSKVFKKDFYIIDGSYVYSGKLSQEEIPGLMICEIEEPYKEYLRELDITNKKMLYIPDIKTFKDDFTAKIVIDNDTSYKDMRDKIFTFVDGIKQTSTWNPLEVDNEIFFDRKEIVELPSNKKEIPDVIIGIQMIPLLTEKNISNLFYSCDNDKSGIEMSIYKVIFDFTLPQFRLMIKYNYVSLVD